MVLRSASLATSSDLLPSMSTATSSNSLLSMSTPIDIACRLPLLTTCVDRALCAVLLRRLTVCKLAEDAPNDLDNKLNNYSACFGDLHHPFPLLPSKESRSACKVWHHLRAVQMDNPAHKLPCAATLQMLQNFARCWCQTDAQPQYVLYSTVQPQYCTCGPWGTPTLYSTVSSYDSNLKLTCKHDDHIHVTVTCFVAVHDANIENLLTQTYICICPTDH